MMQLFGILQFGTGLVLIIWSKRLAAWNASVFARRAQGYTIPAIANTKWQGPFMLAIFRTIMIIWGIVLIMSAYVTVFGSIDLTKQGQQQATTTTSP